MISKKQKIGTEKTRKLRDDLGLGASTIASPRKPAPEIIESGISDSISQVIFDADHCADIIKKHSPAEWAPGLVHGITTAEGVPSDVRTSSTTFLTVADDVELFDMLLAIALKGNEHFQFDIDFFDAVQLAKYEEGDFYDWHMDIGPQQAGNRKLSMTVQLSSPESYEGGDLELSSSATEGHIASREIGSVTVFPSFTRHRITPVRKGTRYSLVVWCSGERRFR